MDCLFRASLAYLPSSHLKIRWPLVEIWANGVNCGIIRIHVHIHIDYSTITLRSILFVWRNWGFFFFGTENTYTTTTEYQLCLLLIFRNKTSVCVCYTWDPGLANDQAFCSRYDKRRINIPFYSLRNGRVWPPLWTQKNLNNELLAFVFCVNIQVKNILFSVYSSLCSILYDYDMLYY